MPSNRRWAIVVATIAVIAAVGAMYFLFRPDTAPRPSAAAEPPASEISQTALPAPAISAPPVSNITETPPQAPVAAAPHESPAPPVKRASPFPGDGRAPIQHEVAFSGRVTDLHGKPVPHANIIMLPNRMSFYTDSYGHYIATQPVGMSIASDGGYALVPAHGDSTYEIVATHDDFSDSDRITISSTVKEVNFTLKPLGAIEGRVVSARDGAPITEFRIRPQPVLDSALPEVVEFRRMRTDVGQFRLDRIKAGTTAVAVGAKGYADTVVVFPPVTAGNTRERVEVRLENGAELYGRVVNKDGQGLRLARVSGGQLIRGAIADSDGNFRLDSLPTGPFELTVKHEDYAPKTVTVALGNGAVNRTQILLTSGTVIEGEFTVGGKGVPGAIYVHVGREQPEGARALAQPVPQDQNQVLRARAGEDGRFRILQVPAGPLRVEGVLEMSSGCACTWRKTIELTAVEDTTNTVDFHFPPNDAIVEGTVYVAAGKSLIGFGSLYTSYADFTPEGATSIVIDARTQRGYYSVCLPSGRTGLWLSIRPEQPYDGPLSKDFVVDFEPGDHIARDIFLYGGATLRVTLGGPTVPKTISVLALLGEVDLGETLTKESMTLMAPGGQGMMEPDGIAKIWGLEPGTYTLCAFDFSQATDSTRVLASTVVNVEKDANMNVELNLQQP